jgi:SsrA-binding protein
MNGKIIATNRKAKRDYILTDFYEAGLVLRGSEIKSIRARQVSLNEAYVYTDGQEAWLTDAYIAPYEQAGIFNHDPRRRRKLLLHRREIDRLWIQVRQKGMTIIPTKLYLKQGHAKVEIAVAKGKRQYDKRQAIAKRDTEREIERHIKERYK